MKLTFYGAAKTVTGSNYLLETEKTKILIDCGLHQGSNFCERHNWDPFQYDPQTIDAVFVTHAHIDHTGRLPQLVQRGFQWVVYSTPPTRAASELLLLDSEHLLHQEAQKFGRPVLYDTDDVNQLMKQWRGISYHEPISVGDITVTAYDSGHILGSSFYVLEAEGKTIVFSGDLGNVPMPMLHPTEIIESADYCVMEATYGARVHENLSLRKDELEDAIEEVAKAGGTLIIPAFAMERTQELLFELNDLVQHGRIPTIPIFLDSPLAIKLTTVYQQYKHYLNPETRARMEEGEDIFDFKGLRTTLTTEESKTINNVPSPKVVIAGSGMSNGGRILHHERRYLSDEKSMVLIIGYQSRGSLGRQLLDGEKIVRILGEDVPVRATIRSMSGYSAHADSHQLFEWVRPMRHTLKKLFLVHSEEDQSRPFAGRVIAELAVDAYIPEDGETIVL